MPIKVAAAKGFVAGALKLMRKDHSMLDYALRDEVCLLCSTKLCPEASFE